MKDQELITLMVKRGVGFSLATVILYCIFLLLSGGVLPMRLTKNLVYRRASLGNTLTRLSEAKAIKNVDILFLGSSHAYRGFDPRIFEKAGYKTFNLGSSAQTPLQTELLVERYLDKINPRIVVYEVYGTTFSIDGIESSLDILSNDQNDLSSIKLVVKQRNLKVFNTLLYSEIRNLLGISVPNEPRKRHGEEYISGGYVERREHTRVVKHEQQTWELREGQFKTFEEIITKIRSKKIKLLLVQSPISKSRYKAITNNKDFDTRMAKYGRYLNFNNMTNLDDSLDFYDSHHLNQDGVTKFNQAFLPFLDSIK